jgi:hypothetical protein
MSLTIAPDLLRLLTQHLEIGQELQDLVLVDAPAEGLHRAGAAGIDDLEAAAIGAGARAFRVATDQARADPAGAVLEMAGRSGVLGGLMSRVVAARCRAAGVSWTKSADRRVEVVVGHVHAGGRRRPPGAVPRRRRQPHDHQAVLRRGGFAPRPHS